MKTKSLKLKKYTKAIFAILLAILLSFSCVLFSGCNDEDDVDDGEGTPGGTVPTTFFENYIAGISAVYANKADGSYSGLSTENTDSLLTEIKSGLLSNYGNGDSSTKYAYSDSAPFYDSIRMLVTNESGITSNTSNHWNWLINPNESGILLSYFNPDPTNADRRIDNSSYENWRTGFADYLSERPTAEYSFPTCFADILQIVLYEIMLGYDNLTTIEVLYGDHMQIKSNEDPTVTSDLNCIYYQVKIKNNSNSDINNTYAYNYVEGASSSTTIGGTTYHFNIEPKNETTNQKLTDYKNALQTEYKTKARYTGLTKQNADKLIDYILNEIIGTDLVIYDYNTYNSNATNYRNYVSTIAYLVYSQTYDGSGDNWTYTFKNGGTEISYLFNQGEQEKATTKGLLGTITNPTGSYSSKPATYVKYFEGENFFGDPDATDQFQGKPYAEYQSILIVPEVSIDTTIDGGLKLEAGFVFNFMSKNKNLKINSKVRCCLINSEGDKFFYEVNAGEINFNSATSFVNSNGETCYEDDFDFGLNFNELDSSLIGTTSDGETCYTVGFFNGEGANDLKDVTEETCLASPLASDVQNLYKVIESENGFGGTTVINEKKLSCSFFEITFDIVKSATDPENTDYNFSLILSNSIIYPGIY